LLQVCASPAFEHTVVNIGQTDGTDPGSQSGAERVRRIPENIARWVADARPGAPALENMLNSFLEESAGVKVRVTRMASDPRRLSPGKSDIQKVKKL
jgi:hypothetical protein